LALINKEERKMSRNKDLKKTHTYIWTDEDSARNNKYWEQLNPNPMFMPPYVYNFLDLFIAPEARIFDPWLTRDSFLVYRNKSGMGYCLDQSEVEFIESNFNNISYSIKLGDAVNKKQDLSEFDAIVSFPPPYMRNSKQDPYNIRNRGISLSGNYSIDLLIKYSESVNSSNTVIILCSGIISFHEKLKQVLKKKIIGIKALFHLKKGSHLPIEAPESTYLVIPEKGYQGKTFVAELSDNPDTNEIIFNNYKNEKVGKSIQLGLFVDYNSFKSFESLSKIEELKRKGRTTGHPPIRFEEIIIENGIASIRDEGWALENHNSNCIYIPKIGNSPSVIYPSDLKINLRNCFRVELVDDTVAPDYLVKFLRTPLGQLSLDSCKTGTAQQILSRNTLKDVLLFLPEYRDQIKAIAIDNKVTAYINDFKEMKDKLWSHPREQSAIKDQLKPFEDLNSVERWFDGIPFPLSSILWKYHSTTNNKDKYLHLLHFFEALPQFLSMLLLSSFHQNKEFYKAESEVWLKNEPKYRDWYRKTNFGSWNNLLANLAKASRSLIGNKKKKEITLSLLGHPNSNFLNFITSKSVFNILDNVREIRNRWHGHGGISGEEENHTRLTILEEKLNELRKVAKDSFSTCLIIVPRTSSYEDGLYKYKVKVLIGNRTPFKEIDVESTKPMDVKKLYMLHEGQNTPIELLPFIKYHQESKACYFYNKVESGNTRWISFHYEKKAEKNELLDEKFSEVLNLLRQND
jgi:hypothetical protein